MERDIDLIIARLRTVLPQAFVTQLTVSHPGVDDDGLWTFRVPACVGSIQLESSTGNLPFLVEHDGTSSARDAVYAKTVDAAVDEIVAYLSLSPSP